MDETQKLVTNYSSLLVCIDIPFVMYRGVELAIHFLDGGGGVKNIPHRVCRKIENGKCLIVFSMLNLMILLKNYRLFAPPPPPPQD